MVAVSVSSSLQPQAPHCSTNGNLSNRNQLEISSFKPTTKTLSPSSSSSSSSHNLKANHDVSQLSFTRMLSESVDIVSSGPYRMSLVFDTCRRLSAVKEGKQLHGLAIKAGLHDNALIQRALVRMYAKCRECEDASTMYARCSRVDVVCQNDLISGFVRNGELEAARRVFDEMPKRNVVSWSIMVDGYSRDGKIEMAQRLFDEMPERNQFSWTSLISGYFRCGLVEVAQRLFEQMPERNVVAWTIMISGYTKNLLFKEALDVFFLMQEAGVAPNRITLISIIPAISEMGALTQGRWVHAYADRTGMKLDGALGSALVDMYCKCGCIDEAVSVFENLKRKEISAWNSIILGLAAHGRGHDALHIFSRLQELPSLSPNEITFIGVLSACSHAGLVDEGWRMFDIFTKFYKLTPNINHYGCMVDLLGRAGHLEEAKDLIQNMPMKPNLIIWKSLLGACRIHKNVEIAKHISRTSATGIERDPKDSGFYALLSNVFAEAELWDDMGEVRREMNDMKLRKVAGCSWVDVDGVVHEFTTGGVDFHARGEEILSTVFSLKRLVRTEMRGPSL